MLVELSKTCVCVSFVCSSFGLLSQTLIYLMWPSRVRATCRTRSIACATCRPVKCRSLQSAALRCALHWRPASSPRARARACRRHTWAHCCACCPRTIATCSRSYSRRKTHELSSLTPSPLPFSDATRRFAFYRQALLHGSQFSIFSVRDRDFFNITSKYANNIVFTFIFFEFTVR